MRRIWTLLALCLGVCGLFSHSLAAEDSELARRVDAYVAPFLAAGHLSGSLLVADGDEVLLARSWGQANHEHQIPNTATTRFGVASVSKPITIALVCRLAEEGKLNPADPISKWIPEFPRGDEATISHLLNHRACVPHRVTAGAEESVPRTARDMVDLVLAAEMLPHEPGAESVYSSAGFSVLAYICELAAEAPFEAALRRYVIEPLRLENTGHSAGSPIVANRAQPYFLAGELRNAALKDLSFLVGAGSLYSTPTDLHRIMRGAMAGELGAAAQMALRREEGLRWNGVTSGFRAFADWNAESDIYVIFAGNLVTGATDLLREDLPRLVAGDAVPAAVAPTPQLVPLAVDALREFEGTYRSDWGREFAAEIRGEDLFFGDWILLPESPTRFFSPQDYAHVEFVRGADGTVERLDWIRGSDTYAWPRIAPRAAETPR